MYYIYIYIIHIINICLFGYTINTIQQKHNESINSVRLVLCTPIICYLCTYNVGHVCHDIKGVAIQRASGSLVIP